MAKATKDDEIEALVMEAQQTSDGLGVKMWLEWVGTRLMPETTQKVREEEAEAK
jgi:hypothetical protein